MQNVQSAAEIQQRVINLVELYRTKVGKESKIAKDAKEDYDFWEQKSIDMMVEEGLSVGSVMYVEGSHNEIWSKHLMVNEQLLGHFYAKVAGENAEKRVLEQLLPELYDASIFSDEEENFLMAHFQEMVNYIVQTPCNDLAYVNRYDNKDLVLIPSEILSLIKSRVNIPADSTIYNPFAGFGQLACLYHDCKSYCGIEIASSDSGGSKEYQRFLWAWLKVSMYANEINVEIVEEGPSDFDAAVSYIPFMPKVWESVKRKCDGYTISDNVDNGYDPIYTDKVERMFDNLKENGKMVIVTRKEYFYKVNSPLKPLLSRLVAENAIVEIIQLPHVMSMSLIIEDSFVILVAEKGRKSGDTTMIDASETYKKCEDKHFPQKFDLDAFAVLLNNSGKDSNTGLRKVKRISPAELRADILIPQVYVIERPDEKETPRPLSDLCTLVTTKISDVNIPANKVLPWVKSKNLSAIYHGAVDVTLLNKIGVSKEVGTSLSKELDPFGFLLKKEEDVSDVVRLTYRMCTYLSGQDDVVVFNFTDKDIETALIKACDTSIAVNNGLLVLRPNKGIDAESILALIRMPIVYRQILAYKDYYLFNHVDDILVPTDKRVINDEMNRLSAEEQLHKVLQEKIATQKTEYINEVRMRKHDMGQYIFELMNIEDVIRYYLDNRDSEKDFCQKIGELLDNFRTSLGELSTLVDNLSKEEKFGEPFPLRIDFFSTLSQRHKVDGYDIECYLDRESIKKYGEKMEISFESGEDEFFLLPVINVSPIDLQRMCNNILDNAKKHGFTDANRKDYVVRINVSVNVDRNMCQIDFRNNGNPLPDGMNKMRYGIKGEKAGKTGGTGLGGNYVKSFVEHYGGEYDIFMEDEWTVIRICLPI